MVKWLACIGMNPRLCSNHGQDSWRGAHPAVHPCFGVVNKPREGSCGSLAVTLAQCHGVMGHFLPLAFVTEISIKVMSSLSVCLQPYLSFYEFPFRQLFFNYTSI